MQVVQFEIEDRLVNAIGMQSVKAFLDRQIALLRLNFWGEKISQVIQESGIDHRKEVNEARQEAWQEYKNRYLQDML